MSKEEDFEDGELPEDGEICDDEEPSKPTPTTSEKPSEAPRRIVEPKNHSPPRRRERFDEDPFGSHTDAPDEFFGSGDKDYRSAPASGAGGAASEEEAFTDTDYRTSNRRRRLSPASHDDVEYESRSKRPFFGGGRGGFRGGGGGFRNNPKPRFQTEHQICKFFREGFCRDGDNCLYSHQAEDSLRRPVLCNFYANSFCKKGLQCLMLHGEFPCKEFHKGTCQNEKCHFSHVPLTDYTRPIIEKILADEEARQPHQPPVYRQNPVANAAAAAAAANVMPRRRVLLPGGPNLSGTSPPHAAPIIHAPVPQPSHLNGGQLPPPAVVVPTIQRNPSAAQTAPLYPPVGAGGYFNSTPAARPEQVQGLPPPRTIEPPRPSSHMQQGPSQQMMMMSQRNPNQMVLPQPGLIQPPQPEKRPPSPPAFNLEAMLSKLANGDKLKDTPKSTANLFDDSPASPPPASNHMDPFGLRKKIAVIPQNIQVTWCTIKVQKRSAYSSVENPDRIPANDPRRQKAISKQFDAFSTLLSTGGTVVSDPRLRAQKEKSESVRSQNSMPFSSWMPQIS